ncbi:hypothetical protein FJT64_026394 [Amphibalanus amphitrite]|uniref:C2H2-type domain-containing protein n=1 Tax=Amphibalanus amphitrite TaxID=1232801 RepID=A0A6A4WGW3_AMPAM|nr:hypothetical protein FJT64_026394 [Amphibalanus amphitrite]
MSTHSNDKPYYCWACCLSFRSQEYLRRHFKRVHLQGGSSGEPRSNLHHEGQQRSTEELSASNQSVIEPVRDTPQEQHSSDTPPLSQDRHSAEAEVALDDGSDDEPMATRKAKTATGSSPKMVGPPGTALGTQKPASPTTRPRSSAADPGKSKDTLSVYLCDGCGHLVLQNHAMVLGNKQPGHSAKPLVLCKVCFIKKTGIICID